MASGFRSVLWLLGLGAGPAVTTPEPAPIPEYPPAETGWEFYLRHVGRDGSVKQAVLNPLFARWTRGKYSGRLDFGLSAGADEVDTFVPFDLVEVWVRNTRLGIMDTTAPSGRGFVMDDRYIYRESGYETDEDGVTTWVSICQDKWSILSWRRVLWPTGIAGYTEFTGVEVETVGKNLVKYNCTDAITSGNRWRPADLATGMGFDITVATDQARGVQIERTTNGGDIQSIIESISSGSGGDFTLTWTGLTALTFDYQEGQQGEDRYNEVIFSVDKRNMKRPRSRHHAIGAATAAIVAGQGRDGARQIKEVEGDGYAADNDIELFVDARDLTTSAGLVTRGRQKLAEQAATDDLSFEVVQTSDTFYSPVQVSGRKTYNVGDRVQAQYFGTYDQQVTGITFNWHEEVPGIGVELAGYVPMDDQDEVMTLLVDKLRLMANDLAAVEARPVSNKDKYDASIDPTVNDDSTAGFNKGSLWITPTKILACRSAAAGAAVWDQVN